MNKTILLVAGFAAGVVFGGDVALTPNRYDPLPVGAIRPEGWLGLQLEQMTEGIVGQDAQPAALQESPAFTTAPLEKVRFIPMCCARSHVTVLPRGTDDTEEGVRWKPTPEKTLRKDRAKFFRQ